MKLAITIIFWKYIYIYIYIENLKTRLRTVLTRTIFHALIWSIIHVYMYINKQQKYLWGVTFTQFSPKRVIPFAVTVSRLTTFVFLCFCIRASPWGWQEWRSKHVGENFVNKLHYKYRSASIGYLYI